MTDAVKILLLILVGLFALHIVAIIFILIKNYKQYRQLSMDQRYDYLIVYATQSGHALHIAQETKQSLLDINKTVQLIDFSLLTIEQLQYQNNILWIVSTYGEGDSPDHARHVATRLFKQQLDLSHLNYAILALGDKHYTHYCQFGLNLAQWLQQQHAKPLFDTVCVDNLAKYDLDRWKNHLANILDIDQFDLNLTQQVFPMILQQREVLNEGSIGEPIYRLKILAQDLHWQAGDILELQCKNSSNEINDFIAKYQLLEKNINISIDDLTQILINKNLRKLPEKFLENIDSHNVDIHAMQQFDDLPFRSYSIASIYEQGFIELVVRLKSCQQDFGLGSGLLCKKLALQEQFFARIQPNFSFNVDIDSAQHSAIFIGNGTGIAGLLSHLRQREVWAVGSKNWLIFGERQAQYDRLYAEQIDNWLHNGFLTQVDYAFSRDQENKIYVQDVIKQHKQQIMEWITQGAMIFVCGSLEGMASGVEQSLKEVLGEALFEQLKAQQRYKIDAY